MEIREGEVKRFFKESTNPETSCLECRLLSATALGIGGVFLFEQRHNFGKIHSFFQTCFSAGLLVLAFTRVMDLPPFGPSNAWRRNSNLNNAPTDEKEDNPKK